MHDLHEIIAKHDLASAGAHGLTIAGAPQGMEAAVLRALAEHHDGRAVCIALDDAGMERMRASLIFCGVAEARIKTFPAWDCLPYDRVSPRPALVGSRVECLGALLAEPDSPFIVLTTINAWLQKTMPRDALRGAALRLAAGEVVSDRAMADFFTANGYRRCDTVRETGEYARRGGIVDICPPGFAHGIRADFFGDTIESLRRFDPETQRSGDAIDSVVLYPAAEFSLTDSAISEFRGRYLDAFGGEDMASGDVLYKSVSEGRHHPGLEHMLPLFHGRLEHLSDYTKGFPVLLAHDVEAAAQARLKQIAEFYKARIEFHDGADMWRALPPDALYLDGAQWQAMAQGMHRLSPFAAQDGATQIDLGGRGGMVFHKPGDAKHSPAKAVAELIPGKMKSGGAVILAATSAGAAAQLSERVAANLPDHIPVMPLPNLAAVKNGGAYSAVWPVEDGFTIGHITVISEKDIYGGRMIAPHAARRRRRGENFLREASALETGDLVVHVDHGIGRYEGLQKITSQGVAHDCLLIVYAGGDRLFLPVENIDLLSRYGKDNATATLDRLGGVAWQSRRARIKGRLRDIAGKLIAIAARRETATCEAITPDPESYAAFLRGFAFVETEDQSASIAEVMADLASGQVMDRLVCGDVGFGKTEIAMRAAFAVAKAGYQVAVVTPTTLLARQHAEVFGERFRGHGIKIGTLSRLTKSRDAAAVKKHVASGECGIVIGTHALLGKSVAFSNLGLVIVDEEQHFGVSQKERLKEMRGNIHVLTLSATPIPRTLQMALTGVRPMSIIATPPVDRLAVRTSIGVWDRVVLAEAIRRERFRGGQVFCVAPRIDHLAALHDRLTALAPEARIITAHGRMPPAELDDAMTRFGEGGGDILLSTHIIESGLDIPRANTMIIHRADMFGLSQLYQLRGRIGRGRLRAYAYLTTEPDRMLTQTARRRLEVMQTLDELGAGFTLASHDLDIRGAGNLLGEEQSGHVKEVGVELYQNMLAEAVKAARLGAGADATESETGSWSPVVNLGMAVLIPDGYVPDLTVRLALYRRMASLNDDAEIDALAAELIDRFGAIPDEVRNLFATLRIKTLCRRANVARIDAGPKGLSLSFRNDVFPKPDRLVAFIAANAARIKIGADHRLVYSATLPIAERADAATNLLGEVAALLA